MSWRLRHSAVGSVSSDEKEHGFHAIVAVPISIYMGRQSNNCLIVIGKSARILCCSYERPRNQNSQESTAAKGVGFAPRRRGSLTHCPTLWLLQTPAQRTDVGLLPLDSDASKLDLSSGNIASARAMEVHIWTVTFPQENRFLCQRISSTRARDLKRSDFLFVRDAAYLE